MTSTTYLVSGMTCGHCVAAVEEEVGAVPGVEAVDVDLVGEGTSRVTVTGAPSVDQSAVRAAIVEAGYAVTSRP